MALPPFGSDEVALPDQDYRTLALSLIRLHGYVEPGLDLLDDIVCDARAAAAADQDQDTAPIATVALTHLDRLVRAAAENVTMQATFGRSASAFARSRLRQVVDGGVRN